jgi:signal transduction histidine kinase
MKKGPHLSFRYRSTVVYPLAIYLISVLIFTVWRYNTELNERLADIDKRLLIGTRQIALTLPEEFFSKCTSKGAISDEEHRKNMETLNNWVNTGGYEYLYTIHNFDNELFYTATSYKDHEDPDSDDLAFGYSLKNSNESNYKKIMAVFEKNEPVYFNNEDQWGEHRSCMVATQIGDGPICILGADFEISYIREQLRSEIPKSILMALFFFCAGIPFIYVIDKDWRTHTSTLENLNEQLKADIEYRRIIERELMAAKDKAEIAVSTQKHFLANISHEIRTPMNGIFGMSELLKTSELNETQKRFVEVIQQSSNHLLQVIEDLLTYAKIDSAKLRISHEDVNINDIVSYTISILDETLKSYGVDIKLTNSVKGTIVTDPTRLSQILINIVGNAIKFSRNTPVTIDIHKNKEDSSVIEFVVTDKGIGIPENMLESIFEPFIQVDNSSTRPHQGTGLGLAISKKLTSALGGSIKVESELGKGSKFYFTIKNMNQSDSESSHNP